MMWLGADPLNQTPERYGPIVDPISTAR